MTEFLCYDSFVEYFKKVADSAKEDKHAPSKSSFDKAYIALENAKGVIFTRGVLIRHINRYIKENKLHDTFVKDALMSEILFDAMHGNRNDIFWLLKIDNDDDATKAAIQYVLEKC